MSSSTIATPSAVRPSVESPAVHTDTPLRRAMRLTLATGDGVGPLVARLGLGLVMFPHGAQKVLGWFGGYGLQGTYEAFTGSMGIPAPFAALAIATEFVAPFLLVLGLGARLGALGIAGIMVVATAMVHLPNGFFMNWFGQQKGEGFEYHLLALALALVVIVEGAGRASLDRRLAARL